MKELNSLEWLHFQELASISAKIFDFSWICLSAFFAYSLMTWKQTSGALSIPALLPGFVVLVAVLTVVCQSYLGVYQSWRGRTKVVLSSRLVMGYLLTAIMLMTLGICLQFFYPVPVESILKMPEWMLRQPERLSSATELVLDTAAALPHPRYTLTGTQFPQFCFIWLGFVIAGGLLFRVPVYLLLNSIRTRGFNQKQLILVGTDQSLKTTEERLTQSPWLGLKISQRFIIDTQNQNDLSNPEQLEALAAQISDIGELWICLPLKEEPTIQLILYHLRHSTINIRYFPDFSGYQLLNHKSSEIAGLYSLDLSCSPMEGGKRFIKSLEDRIFSFLILLLCAPLMLTIALAIKLTSKGPVLFKQYRHGIDGRRINIYKFRSMKVHQETAGVVTQATAGDNRITPIGRFLRRTSLDELPQLINVLQGKMSLVGPRPHALAHNEAFKDQVDLYMKRHKVKPGITGWAQVNGFRGETDTLDKMRQRIEHDLFYINNWSLLFDFKILAMTIVKGFVHPNAY